jgi:putative RNA 2'-phosphotransferase
MNMNAEQTKKTSKFLSLVLRHQPERIGIELDESGWVRIDTLLSAMDDHGRPLTRETLQFVVDNNDKQRFSISPDGTRIRANQGHSVEVDLGYEPSIPPEILYHGTPRQFVELIRRDGLHKMRRHHVHLHEEIATATAVGNRRGKAVLLKVRAQAMHAAGHVFYVTANHVWLTDYVPSEFIEIPG